MECYIAEKNRECSFYKKSEATRNLVSLMWAVIEFKDLFGCDGYDGRREGLRDEWANGRLIEIAKMVEKDCSNGYNPDTILAEYRMNNAIRPLTLQEAMLTDRRAERASIRLSRLVESGRIDPVVAEGFIDSGLNPRILENIKDKLIKQGAIDVEAYKNPERHYSYLV